MTTFIVVIAAAWLAQRIMAARQAMHFRTTCVQLRFRGLRVSVGLARSRTRRVYVVLGVTEHGIVAEAKALRGVTVFAGAQDEPALVGRQVTDLTADRAPAGIRPLVAEAARQAATELTRQSHGTVRTPDPTALRSTETIRPRTPTSEQEAATTPSAMH